MNITLEINIMDIYSNIKFFVVKFIKYFNNIFYFILRLIFCVEHSWNINI